MTSHANQFSFALRNIPVLIFGSIVTAGLVAFYDALGGQKWPAAAGIGLGSGVGFGVLIALPMIPPAIVEGIALRLVVRRVCRAILAIVTLVFASATALIGFLVYAHWFDRPSLALIVGVSSAAYSGASLRSLREEQHTRGR